MLVLVCLAEHAGQMVPKDRLFQSAWPDTAVTDDVLTRAVSELRCLFEDDPRQPRVQVAFSWNGEAPTAEPRPWWQGDWDNYVKLVGASELRRLIRLVRNEAT